MTYAETLLGDRLIHDADSHVMEGPESWFPFADPDVRERMRPLYTATTAPGEDDLIEHFAAKHADPEFRARDADEIMQRKNWKATGSFLKEDRPYALDLLGFQTQLVFNTFGNKYLLTAEHGDDGSVDPDFAYGLARAHNRFVVDFCSTEPKRLMPVGYVPLPDFEASEAFAAEAIEMGCKGLMIASACPKGHSPSHIGLDPVWARAQEAGIPVIFHVGGGGDLLDPSYFENGLPPIPDFHGGEENFRSVDYMAIPYPVMQTLGTMIIDGVMERFPDLRFGVIEQGASWLPGWLRMLDSAQHAFHKNEERLRALSLRPSEYVLRQVRATPYPAEDVGWIIENSGPEVCLFSSDYPHVEGGRNPIARFEKSLDEWNIDERRRQRFYCDNFADLMGSALAG